MIEENINIITPLIENNKEVYSLARWAALYESINMIADKAEERKVSFDKIELKPLKILEYIDSTSDIIMRKLLEQKKSTKSIENWHTAV